MTGNFLFEGPASSTIATLGIDIGKNTFHVIGLDAQGAIVVKQKLSRRRIVLNKMYR